jgi:PmbA protein
MDIFSAIEKLAGLAKGAGVEFDILAQHIKARGLSVFASRVQNREASETVGIGIRVLKDGRPGYASTEQTNEAALRQTLADALANAKLSAPIDIELPSVSELPPPLATTNPALKDLSQDTLKDTCLAIESQIRGASPEIINVPDLGAELHHGMNVIANSKGVFHKHFHDQFGVYASAVAERGGVRKMGFHGRAGRDWTVFDPQQLASVAVERALEILGAQSIQSGKYPVVLDERISAKLLALFLQNFFAEFEQKGLSRLSGKVGTQIAAPCLTLWSDPHRADLISCCQVDGEGIPTRRQAVVQNGVFGNFLYTLESAKKAGVEALGNASRAFGTRVGTTWHNCVAETGSLSTQELLAQYPRALHIVHLEGVSGCQPVSGALSIGAQGFWCENGKRIHPVDGITLSTNFYDLLQNIDSVGSTHSNTFSPVKIPAIAVSEVAVSA